jgi:integrase
VSVRQRRWKDKKGRMQSSWQVHVCFPAPDGQVREIRRTSPVNTRRGAEEYERQLRTRLLNGSLEKASRPEADLTVAQFADRFLDWSAINNKPSTVYAKRIVVREHLLPAFGALRLDAVLFAAIETYKAKKLREKFSAKSINNHLAVLGKLLNLAAEMGEVEHVARVKGLRVEKSGFNFLDFEEAERFLGAAEPEWLALLLVALRTGLRVGELLALKWEDVDLKVGRLIVRRTLWNGQEGSPKSGRAREVPLGDEVLHALKEHRHLRARVFCHEDGAPFTHSELKDVVPRTCRKAGLAKRLTMHDLRHTFASHLTMRGVTPVAVKELLGHADLTTTMRYAHLAPSITRDAVQLLNSRPRSTWTAHGT